MTLASAKPSGGWLPARSRESELQCKINSNLRVVPFPNILATNKFGGYKPTRLFSLIPRISIRFIHLNARLGKVTGTRSC